MTLLTAPQAAAALNVSLRTLERLTASRAISHIRLTSRTVRYPAAELTKFLEKRTVKSNGPTS